MKTKRHLPTSVPFFQPAATLAGLLTCLCLAFAHDADAQTKIGMVDMNKVFNGYYKAKDAQAKNSEAHDAAVKELEERMESHKQLLDEINTLNKDVDNAALSAGAKAERNKKRDDKIAQVRALEQEIQDFQKSRQNSLQEQLVRMRNQIVEEIMTVVNARVKSDNYDLVLDKSGQALNGVNVVIYSNDKMDFSDDVIATLNKNRPGAAAPAAKPAAPAAPVRK